MAAMREPALLPALFTDKLWAQSVAWAYCNAVSRIPVGASDHDEKQPCRFRAATRCFVRLARRCLDRVHRLRQPGGRRRIRRLRTAALITPAGRCARRLCNPG